MEHLLFLVHRLPYPPDKGDKIRSWHLLRHLLLRYHVHLGTFVDDPDDWKYAGMLEALCASTRVAPLRPASARARSLGALATGRALSVEYYRNAGLQQWVDRTVARHAIRRVLVFSSPMAQYAMTLRQTRRVADFVDIDSDKWRQYAVSKRSPMRWLYGYEARHLLAYERAVAEEFDASLFVSDAEAALFRTLAPGAAVKVSHFSNGVDTAYFDPEAVTLDPYPSGHAALVFTGAMDYWPNVDAVQWFAREILPVVRKTHPAAHFHIVGARPAPAVQDLARLPGVHVTGRVADVRPYLAHAQLAVAPLRVARGIQNKVLEAMAMACPTVVTPQALEGIDAQPGRDLLLATTATEFAQTVVAQLDGRGSTLGRNARRRVLAGYGWEANLACIDALLEGTEMQAAGAAVVPPREPLSC